MTNSSQSKYSEAGVDIDKGNAFVEDIKDIVSATHTKDVMGNIGGFASHYEVDLKKFPAPVLVNATDGVGTKLAVAHLCKKHDTIGIDLVAMCVNDLIVGGATPLCFLDYFAVGKLDLDVAKQIVSGIAEGCKQSDCALVGGETAEMPGLYQGSDYDLAGFVTGMVNKDEIIDGSKIKNNNAIIGISSNGIHSNGYSLVRKVCFSDHNYQVSDFVEQLGCTLGEELLKPTKIYVKPVLELLKNHQVNGMVHVTGGGFYDNIPRVVPDGLGVEVDATGWKIPPIFDFLQEKGDIPKDEMFRTFNMGIGLVLFIENDTVEEVLKHFNDRGYPAHLIGKVTECSTSENAVIIKD